ncbi:MAG: hypothetical protein ACM3SY_15875 [Candidatus Omnitrophota bacterium]
MVTQIQSGVFTVGSHGNYPYRFIVTFEKPFNSIPVFVANTLQGAEYSAVDLPDTYAVSVKSVTRSEATVQIWRVDKVEGWGQNLRLGWMAIGS